MVPGAESFESAAPGLNDLRVVEKETQIEVRYKLVVERGDRRGSALPLSIRDLSHVAGEYMTFVVDTGQEGTLHNEMEIPTTNHNFQRGVVLEASFDGNAWAAIQESQIFDFTIAERGFMERLTWIQYPSSTVRYMRVRIINDS